MVVIVTIEKKNVSTRAIFTRTQDLGLGQVLVRDKVTYPFGSCQCTISQIYLTSENFPNNHVSSERSQDCIIPCDVV